MKINPIVNFSGQRYLLSLKIYLNLFSGEYNSLQKLYLKIKSAYICEKLKTYYEL